MNDDRPLDPDAELSLQATGRASDADRLSTDEIHRLLSNGRRRHVLSFLRTRPGEGVDFDRLVAAVAERERPDPGPETHRDRIEIDLHHVHLPKLVDAGVVAYDPVDRTVLYESRDELESMLGDTDPTEDPEE